MGILATENELSREELLDSILDDSGVVEPSPAKPIRVERKFTPDVRDYLLDSCRFFIISDCRHYQKVGRIAWRRSSTN